MGIQANMLLAGIQVLYKELVHFTGRNGYYKASGLDIIYNGDVMVLTPLTSRGQFANCRIEIPKESVCQVIEALQTLDNQT